MCPVLGITIEQGVYSTDGDRFGYHDWGTKDQVRVKDG